MATKQETKSTAVATQTPAGALELYDAGDDVVEVGKGQAKGTEHQTNQDISIPFLRVLQPLSPQIMEQTPGVKNGDILNLATGEVFDGKTGVLFVCGTTRHAYAAFRDRNKGGGYEGQYEIDSEEVAKARAAGKFGEYKLPSDPDVELVETFYQFGVMVSDDMTVKGMAVMPYSSTAIKAYKNWITQVRAHTVQLGDGRKVMLPLWAHMFRLTTTKHPKSTPAQQWWIPVLTPYKGSIADSALMTVSDGKLGVLKDKLSIYQAAKSAGTAMDSGLAKVDYAQQAKDDGDKGDGGGAPF